MNSNPEGEKHIEELFKTATPVRTHPPRMIISHLYLRSIKVIWMIPEILVKDPLNKSFENSSFPTDNSWMETQAMNMHDETGELTKDLKLEAGKSPLQIHVQSLSFLS